MKKVKFATFLIVVIALLIGISGCSSSNQPQNASIEPAQVAANETDTATSAANETGTATEAIIIRGIVDLVPHSEIVEFVIPKLAERGVEVVVVSTSADSTTNEKTAKGEIDFNFFQHFPYLNEWNDVNGFNLINAGDIHVEPITAYSDKFASVDDLPDNSIVAIPNDGTNEYRALRILEQNGFIVLDESTAASLSASI
ncbi:MAG: MetQ/NlpA family ABC transporter substrate-binding protein, partial [Clostridiales bacterium]|nr:MetQ/NlpA family ABC transporter substrate-binding protein [Clostridiales bacterium]